MATNTAAALVSDAFRSAFRGELIEPGDPGYDEARSGLQRDDRPSAATDSSLCGRR
jgi:hypothetical protein